MFSLTDVTPTWSSDYNHDLSVSHYRTEKSEEALQGVKIGKLSKKIISELSQLLVSCDDHVQSSSVS